MNAPDVGSSGLERAAVLVELKRWDDAITVLAGLVASEPAAARPRCLLAQSLLGAGQPQAALDQASAAATVAPYDDWPHRLRSIALGKLGDRAGAATAAREAVRVRPGSAHAYVVLVDAEIALRNLDAAAAAAAQAMRLAPGLYASHLAVGRVELARHHGRAAEAHFREALRLDPQSAAALNDVGRALLRRGRLRAAVAYFGLASRAGPHEDLFRRNAVLGALRAGLARVVVVWVALSVGLAVSSEEGWNPVVGLAFGVLGLVAGAGAQRARRRSRPVDAPTVDADTLRSLRRQAKRGELFVARLRRPDWRGLGLALLITLGGGLACAYSAINGLVAPDPADPTSRTFYWGLLAVSVAVSVAAAAPFVLWARRRRRASRFSSP